VLIVDLDPQGNASTGLGITHKQRVSSTIIRQSLHAGDFAHARKYLGRHYSLSGRVNHGAKKARQWGTPTANVYINRKVLPLSGVFCVKIKRNDSFLTGVANIGCRPTFDGLRNVLEVHLFDHDESLYGQEIQVFFLHKLREEIKFSAVSDLIAQIHRDIQDAKQWFNQENLIEIL
jgi:riboflavin kinase/FMN adenylyltransferase